MMKKKITKQQWYDDTIEDGAAKAPAVAPNAEKHLEGLNRGEIHINDNSEDPTIFIRDNNGRVIGFKPFSENNIEELKKLFLRKDQPEQTDFLLKLLGGAEIRNGLTVDSLIAEELAKLKKGLNVTGGADIDYLHILETISAKLVDAVQVNATNVTASEQITTLNLLVQALAETYDLNVSHVATMMRTIIKDYVSSEAFTPGLLGEGFKISKAINGDWNLEIDNIVVRKVMTIFEMVISKVRSVNGGLVISPANGRIKSVAETTGSPAYYVIGIEGDMQFVVDDFVRCQVFNGGQAKYYWVRVSSISDNSILVLKSEFTNGVAPAIGDDLVQMGNKTNKARQGLIYLTASEDGKPRISVMDGVNSTSTVGKNKVILGCLDGITDTDFPADFQPSGYGLYAMNVFLKGIFLLRNGKSVESEFETVRNALTTLSQEFSVAMGEFTSKITEVKEYTDGKVDGVIIGSRNLFKGSNDFPLTATDTGVNASYKNETIDGQLIGTVTRIANGNNCYYYGWYASRMSTRPLENKTYVWSIDVCSNCPGRVYFDLTSPYSNMFTTNFNSTDGKWIRISGVIRVNLVPSDLNWRLLLVGVNGSLVGDYVSYKNPMVTEGTKTSSNWTPAPEDVTADAQAKANAAQAAAEAVAIAKAELAKTEASAYADGIVTAEEQRAIADAQAKLAEAKLDAQAKADDAKQAAISDAANKYPTKSEFSTSIKQLSDSISFKADKTEVTDLGNRVSAAEAKITPDAINLTVQSQVNAAAQGAIEKVTKLSSYNAGVYNPQGSAGIFLFKTKILSRSSQMLVVDIDGYMYGDSAPFSVSLVFYTFPSGLTSYGYTVNGVDIVDRIRLAENAGFLAIELRLKSDVYFPGFTVKISSTRVAIPVSYSENWEFYSAYLSHGDLFDGNYSDVCMVPKKDTYAESYTKAEIKVLSDQISLMVKKDDLTITGIDIVNRKITLTADSTVFRNNAGQQIAIFENDRIKADLIDARAIVTGSLLSDVIFATDITTGRITVIDGARIGGMVIENNTLKGGSMILTEGAVVGGFTIAKDTLEYSLVNNDLSAKIEINAPNGRYLRIGGKSSTMLSMRLDGTGAPDTYGNEGIFVQSYGANNICLSLIANAGSAFAIRSFGSHVFGQRTGEQWSAPGVLWCGRYNSWNAYQTPTLMYSWGDGLNRTPIISRYGYGKFEIIHNLGRPDYFIQVIPLNQRADGGQYWASIANYAGIGNNSFSIEFKNDGGSEQCPGEFIVCVFGRNKW